MSNNINDKFREAKNLYDSQNYEESLKIYEQLFNENPDAFSKYNLISYCWAIYKVHVKDVKDEDEIIDAVEIITDLTSQTDLNESRTCPYTFSIFELLKVLNNKNEYYNMFEWLDMIDVELLDDNKNQFSKIDKRSRLEKYYDYYSKAYLECAEWDLCIEFSNEALKNIDSFTNSGDTWHKWRMAKALKELNQSEKALEYLKEVVNVKNEWYVYKEIGENYYILNDNENASRYVGMAILAPGAQKMKVNLYRLAYELLEDLEPEIAYKHIELFYLLKLENKAQIPDEVNDLDINEDYLDKNQLIKEINSFWSQLKFKDQELQYGTVTKFFNDRNYGFIRDDNDNSIFFHKSEFKGDNVYVGQLVSFYVETSFDELKNKKSINAVCIESEV